MARLLSHVASVLRGSIAGITYTSNQYHQIVARSRTAPVQPNTPNQATMRSCFSGAQANWLIDVTPPERTAWDDYAQTCKYPGPLGFYTIPGRLIFTSAISLAKYIKARELAIITPGYIPPVKPGFLNITNVVEAPIAGPVAGIHINVTNESGEAVVLFAERSIAWHKTRMRFKGPWVSELAQAKICLDQATALINFTGLTIGMIYFARIRAVSKVAPHRMSCVYIIRCTARAAVP